MKQMKLLKKMKTLDQTSASETLAKLTKKDKKGKSTVGEVIEQFHENGFALILILFSLPVAIPLPYPPGFTTLFALPLFVLSWQMMRGYHNIKMPNFISKYEVQNVTLAKIATKMIPILEWFEKYLKKRYSFAESVYCEQLVGLLSFIFAFAIAIPLPMTNSIPAWGITIMALGLLKRDGLVIFCGSIVGAVGTIIAYAITKMALYSLVQILKLF